MEVSLVRLHHRDMMLIFGFSDKVQVTNLKGRLKSSRLAPAELRFPFKIEHMGK